jgi:hypothetical protein
VSIVVIDRETMTRESTPEELDSAFDISNEMERTVDRIIARVAAEEQHVRGLIAAVNRGEQIAVGAERSRAAMFRGDTRRLATLAHEANENYEAAVAELLELVGE